MSITLVRVNIPMPVNLSKVEPVKPPRPQKRYDYTPGSVFGRLIIVSVEGSTLRVVCSCGSSEYSTSKNRLASGAKSCGCLQREAQIRRLKTHGLSRTPEYKSWFAMKARCIDPSNHKYPLYGGRGIRICVEWLDFSVFHQYMGNRPFVGATIERIDTQGDYCPGNCKWATPKEQANNRRACVRAEYNGVMYTMEELVSLSGLKLGTLRGRIEDLKWSVKDAVELPLHARPLSKLDLPATEKLYPQQPTTTPS